MFIQGKLACGLAYVRLWSVTGTRPVDQGRFDGPILFSEVPNILPRPLILTIFNDPSAPISRPTFTYLAPQRTCFGRKCIATKDGNITVPEPRLGTIPLKPESFRRRDWAVQDRPKRILQKTQILLTSHYPLYLLLPIMTPEENIRLARLGLALHKNVIAVAVEATCWGMVTSLMRNVSELTSA